MTADNYIIDKAGLQTLLEAIAKSGYQTIAPTVRDDAVVYEPVDSVDALPVGCEDEQEGGHYRLKKLPDDDPNAGALFRTVVGPHTWKRYLFPSEQSLWRATRSGRDWHIEAAPEEAPKRAFVGVKACEIAAMKIQDKVFDNGDFADAGYRERRRQTLVIVANCTRAADTCFCASMNTGPKAASGFDLALTELVGDGDHRFLVEVGSKIGGALMRQLKAPKATAADRDKAAGLSAATAASMKRKMPADAREVLAESREHPHWREVAERCLNCANCTMVCPTCFCSSVEDITSLDGNSTERQRKWDSCFTVGFSYIHGGPVRREGASRYRQWISHKLSTWHDQFGEAGCTGCGRCITWCPVGIDITAEVASLLATEAS